MPVERRSGSRRDHAGHRLRRHRGGARCRRGASGNARTRLRRRRAGAHRARRRRVRRRARRDCAWKVAPRFQQDGPVLFSDVSGRGQLQPILVNHFGDDPEIRWVAFPAVAPGASEGCFLTWNPDEELFEERLNPEGGGRDDRGELVLQRHLPSQRRGPGAVRLAGRRRREPDHRRAGRRGDHHHGRAERRTDALIDGPIGWIRWPSGSGRTVRNCGPWEPRCRASGSCGCSRCSAWSASNWTTASASCRSCGFAPPFLLTRVLTAARCSHGRIGQLLLGRGGDRLGGMADRGARGCCWAGTRSLRTAQWLGTQGGALHIPRCSG